MYLSNNKWTCCVPLNPNTPETAPRTGLRTSTRTVWFARRGSCRSSSRVRRARGTASISRSAATRTWARTPASRVARASHRAARAVRTASTPDSGRRWRRVGADAGAVRTAPRDRPSGVRGRRGDRRDGACCHIRRGGAAVGPRTYRRPRARARAAGAGACWPPRHRAQRRRTSVPRPVARTVSLARIRGGNARSRPRAGRDRGRDRGRDQSASGAVRRGGGGRRCGRRPSDGAGRWTRRPSRSRRRGGWRYASVEGTTSGVSVGRGGLKNQMRWMHLSSQTLPPNDAPPHIARDALRRVEQSFNGRPITRWTCCVGVR